MSGHATLRRVMSASMAEGSTLQLNTRMELARDMLTRFKDSGEVVEEDDLERLIRLLVAGEYHPEFLENIDAQVDDASTEPEAVTLRWLANTYSARGRRDSTISVRSRLDVCDIADTVASPYAATGINDPSSSGSQSRFDDAADIEGDFPMTLPPEQQEHIRTCLGKFDSWDFDVFELVKVTQGRPLLFATWEALRRHKCFDEFRIDPRKMRALLCAVEAGYISSNPYHNATHAADVVQTVHFFLLQCPSGLVNNLSAFALVMAAAGHDVGHNGVNNAFHINTSSTLALRYNDHSVLENHHVATLFTLASSDDSLSAFDVLEHDVYVQFRKLVIALILGTDMSNHTTTVSSLHMKMDVKGADVQVWEDRSILLEAMLHAADISNPVKPTRIAQEWADRCLNEFWNQGDREKSLGLAVSPMCDRTSTSRPQSQIGFINFVVKPFFTLLSKLLPGLAICVEHADANLAHWEKLKAEAAAAAAASSSS